MPWGIPHPEGGKIMKKRYERVYQFKIALTRIKPPIWRRIQVPETYTFWDLHVAIQDAMGWDDYHLHQFKVKDPKTEETATIGIPGEDDADFGWVILPGWEQSISDYFSENNETADYLYDFGDNWGHVVEFEKAIPRDEQQKYPRCVKGKRACPPEDCGGVRRYEDLVEAMKDPEHEERENYIQWLGTEFDAEHFDPGEIEFDDPDARWKIAFDGT